MSLAEHLNKMVKVQKDLQSIHSQAVDAEIKRNEHVMDMLMKFSQLRDMLRKEMRQDFGWKQFTYRLHQLKDERRLVDRKYKATKRYAKHAEKLALGVDIRYSQVGTAWTGFQHLAKRISDPKIAPSKDLIQVSSMAVHMPRSRKKRSPYAFAFYCRAQGLMPDFDSPTMAWLEEVSKKMVDMYEVELENYKAASEEFEKKIDALLNKQWAKAGIV